MDSWCTKKQAAELERMGFEVGENGALFREGLTFQLYAFIWPPSNATDKWWQDGGYRVGYLADFGLSISELKKGMAVVFDDPISAAVYLKIQLAMDK
ncbi:hypothetical protein D3C81_759330 [compost metagenome]